MLKELLRLSRAGGEKVELAISGKAFNYLNETEKMSDFLYDTRIFSR